MLLLGELSLNNFIFLQILRLDFLKIYNKKGRLRINLKRSNKMLKFDITLVIQIIEALILTFILNQILIKPIMSTIRERESQFQALEKKTQEYLSLAEEAIKRYQDELNKARMEGIQKRELFKEEARKFEKEILAKVTKEVEEYKAKWSQEFSKQLEQVRATLLGQKEYFANLIVERLLGRKV